MYSKIKNLFKRYQSGNESPEERELVENWFASFDDQQIPNLYNEEKSILFGQMDKKIEVLLYKRNQHTWLKAAAVLLTVISVSFLIYRLNIAATPVNITYEIIRAPNGVKREIALPDSSIVYLNSGSSVTIPSNFGMKKRELSFVGEAFFIIKHNARIPFTIHAGKLQITDIGTSFDVKAYPEEKQVKVAVETGKVEVEKTNPARKSEVFRNTMIHNQQLIYNEENNSHRLSTIRSESIAAWHNNELRFDNASFDEIARQLERWYNVTVKLNDYEKQHKRYTISFGNEPVSKVMNVLSKLSGATYAINNKTISINLKHNKNMN